MVVSGGCLVCLGEGVEVYVRYKSISLSIHFIPSNWKTVSVIWRHFVVNLAYKEKVGKKKHFSCEAHVKLNHYSGFPNKHWHAAMKMSWMKTVNMHTCIKCYKTSFGKEQLSGDTVACTCAVRFKSCPAGISSTVLTLRLSAETRLAWLYPWEPMLSGNPVCPGGLPEDCFL